MATRTSLMEFQIPRIVHEEVEKARHLRDRAARPWLRLHVRQLRPPRAALVARGRSRHVGEAGRVAHEFTTLPGVREDVTDILLNLKNLICRLHGESRGRVRLRRGPGPVTAADIQLHLEILNPDLEIAHLADKGKLELTMTVGRGRGYVPAELNRGQEHTIGVIPSTRSSRPSAVSRTTSRRPVSASAPTTTSSCST